MMHNRLDAAPWYRGLYGHASGIFSPDTIAKGFIYERKNKRIDYYRSIRPTTSSQMFWDISKGRYEPSEGGNKVEWLSENYIHSYPFVNEPLGVWWGVGYRFLSGHAIELSRVNISSSAGYSIQRGAILTDAPSYCEEQKKGTTVVNGVMLMGKMRSSVLRVAQVMIQSSVFLPDAVKTDAEIEAYTTKKLFSTIVHEFSVYGQAGLGFLDEHRLTTTKIGDAPEVTEKREMPRALAGALGCGAQYHLGSHVSVDFSWAYMMPVWPTSETLGSLRVVKVGLNIYA
jgi:hypothetical protein